MPRRNVGDEKTPSTTFGVITFADAASGVYGIAYQGRIFEASDPQELGPGVGDAVLADYLPSSRQWVIVAVL